MSDTMVSNRTAPDDRAVEVAADIARRWVRWYSGHVGTEAAERRRAEIESDLWEQRADARESGRRSAAVAGSIAWRVVGGVPDDLLWVRTQRLAMRGLQADRKASAMNSLGHFLARWWWVAGAALLAAVYLYFGIDNLVGAYAPLPEAAAQCFILVAFLVAGIALRVKAPRLAGILIATASLPALGLWWTPPILILGGVVAVGAIIEVARLSEPGVWTRSGAVVGTVLLGAAIIAPSLGLEPNPQGNAFVFFVVAIALAAIGIAILVLTRPGAVRSVGPRRPRMPIA